MFDFICAMAAIGNAFVQAVTIKVAADPQPAEKKTEEKPQEENEQKRDGAFTYKDAYRRKDKQATGYQHIYAEKVNVQKAIPGETGETPDNGNISETDWCSVNMELIIELTQPGEHIIKNEILGNVDVDKLSELLFKSIENLEAIEQTEDGLRITTR